MSACPSCTVAEANPRTGSFHTGCTECGVRSLAQGPEYFAARVAGKMLPAYVAVLDKLIDGTIDGDGPARDAMHARVKAWAKRITETKP